MRSDLPKRKSLRLRNYDYNSPGGYFITICSYERNLLFSRIVGAIHESPEVVLSDYGRVVERVVNRLPQHFGVTIDRFVIMPNHIHLIIVIPDGQCLRAIHESPLQKRSLISKVVGYIKMNVSKEVRKEFGDVAVWQRGYHDHVIRDSRDYEMISKYIVENPIKWKTDCFYKEEEPPR